MATNNTTVTEGAIEQALAVFQAASKRYTDLVARKAYLTSSISKELAYFETNACKWKPGRYWGVPKNVTHDPTDASAGDCGDRKNRWFTDKAEISSIDIESAKKAKDEADASHKSLVATAQAQAQLDPGYLAAQRQHALDLQEEAAEHEEELARIEAESEAKKQEEKTKRNVKIAIAITVVLVVIVVVYFVGKKQGWFK